MNLTKVISEDDFVPIQSEPRLVPPGHQSDLETDYFEKPDESFNILDYFLDANRELYRLLSDPDTQVTYNTLEMTSQLSARLQRQVPVLNVVLEISGQDSEMGLESLYYGIKVRREEGDLGVGSKILKSVSSSDIRDVYGVLGTRGGVKMGVQMGDLREEMRRRVSSCVSSKRGGDSISKSIGDMGQLYAFDKDKYKDNGQVDEFVRRTGEVQGRFEEAVEQNNHVQKTGDFDRSQDSKLTVIGKSEAEEFIETSDARESQRQINAESKRALARDLVDLTNPGDIRKSNIRPQGMDIRLPGLAPNSSKDQDPVVAFEPKTNLTKEETLFLAKMSLTCEINLKEIKAHLKHDGIFKTVKYLIPKVLGCKGDTDYRKFFREFEEWVELVHLLVRLETVSRENIMKIEAKGQFLEGKLETKLERERMSREGRIEDLEGEIRRKEERIRKMERSLAEEETRVREMENVERAKRVEPGVIVQRATPTMNRERGVIAQRVTPTLKRERGVMVQRVTPTLTLTPPLTLTPNRGSDLEIGAPKYMRKPMITRVKRLQPREIIQTSNFPKIPSESFGVLSGFTKVIPVHNPVVERRQRVLPKPDWYTEKEEEKVEAPNNPYLTGKFR